jgi:hypothetical protein
MKKKLISLSNYLDQTGNVAEANFLDKLIFKISADGEGELPTEWTDEWSEDVQTDVSEERQHVAQLLQENPGMDPEMAMSIAKETMLDLEEGGHSPDQGKMVPYNSEHIDFFGEGESVTTEEKSRSGDLLQQFMASIHGASEAELEELLSGLSEDEKQGLMSGMITSQTGEA